MNVPSKTMTKYVLYVKWSWYIYIQVCGDEAALATVIRKAFFIYFIRHLEYWFILDLTLTITPYWKHIFINASLYILDFSYIQYMQYWTLLKHFTTTAILSTVSATDGACLTPRVWLRTSLNSIFAAPFRCPFTATKQ